LVTSDRGDPFPAIRLHQQQCFGSIPMTAMTAMSRDHGDLLL
jgi:hypothetical protein